MSKSVGMDYIRALVVSVCTSIAAFLRPISGDIYSLLLIFGINFICGLIAAYCKGESFDLKKAFRCVKESAIFFFLVASIFAVGKFKGNIDGALQCVSFVVYSVVWFYSVNILRNLKNILKEGSTAHQTVCFIYYIVSVEFVKHIPYLSNYLKTKADGGAN